MYFRSVCALIVDFSLRIATFAAFVSFDHFHKSQAQVHNILLFQCYCSRLHSRPHLTVGATSIAEAGQKMESPWLMALPFLSDFGYGGKMTSGKFGSYAPVLWRYFQAPLMTSDEPVPKPTCWWSNRNSCVTTNAWMEWLLSFKLNIKHKDPCRPPTQVLIEAPTTSFDLSAVPTKAGKVKTKFY